MSGAARAPQWADQRVSTCGDRDWGLKLFPINEEFPLSAGHKLALIKSLPFGHTARRYYRLDGLVRSSDRDSQRRGGGGCLRSPGAAPHETSERSSPGKAFRTDTYLQITRCRWRTQLAAITNVNCRTHWSSTLRTHFASPGTCVDRGGLSSVRLRPRRAIRAGIRPS